MSQWSYRAQRGPLMFVVWDPRRHPLSLMYIPLVAPRFLKSRKKIEGTPILTAYRHLWKNRPKNRVKTGLFIRPRKPSEHFHDLIRMRHEKTPPYSVLF